MSYRYNGIANCIERLTDNAVQFFYRNFPEIELIWQVYIGFVRTLSKLETFARPSQTITKSNFFPVLPL